MLYRICLISRSTLAHKRGGLERYAAVLGSALVEAGHDVVMLTSAHPRGVDEARCGGVRTYYVKGTVSGSYAGSFFVKSAKKFFELHKEKPFDIVHSQSYGALGILKKVNVPVIATLHGVWFSETVYERDVFKTLSAADKSRCLLSFPKIFLHHMAMHGFAKHVDKIMFDSVYSKKEFMRLHPSWDESRYCVVPAAVAAADIMQISKKYAREKLNLNGSPHIFSLSRLEATKGFQTALRAFSVLRKQEPSTVYLVGGEGRYKQQLLQLCAAESIYNVQFLGNVSDDKLALYYRAADIFIYPELVHPAFGLSVAEAMACGACVVAARRGALTEVVGDAGVLYTHNDERELASVLADLLKNPQKREELGIKARQRIREHFTKESFVKNVLSIYDEVIIRTPNPEPRAAHVKRGLRILYITAECVPGNTGGSVHAYEAAAHLVKQGHEVTLLCHRGLNQKTMEKCDGVSVVRHNMRLSGKAFSPRALLHFPLMNKPFDVIMERYYATSFLGAFFSMLKRVPLVLEVNNPHFEELKNKKEFPATMLPVAKTISSIAFSRASLIVTPLKDIVPEKAREKVIELPWAVNTGAFHPQLRHSKECDKIIEKYNLRGKWVAVYEGTFRAWQCPDVLVDVAEKVAQKNKDFRLLFVGAGDLYENVRRKIKQKNLEEICILAGEQPYGRMPYFLSAARVGLAPFILSDTMKQTGFYYSPLKIFEYMACGLAVITTDIPSVRNVVAEGKTGFFVPKEWTAQDMSALILQCMGRRDIEEIGKRAREVVEENFSWDAHVSKLIKEMQMIVRDGKENESVVVC